MALVESWDVTKPANTRAVNLGDDDIRELKRGIAERWKRGGHYVDPTTTADNDAGLHFCGGDPDGDANQFVVYKQSAAAPDTSNPAVTIDQDDAGTQRVKLGDGVGGSNAWTLTADVLNGKRYHTINIPLPAAATGRVQGVMLMNREAGDLVIVGTQAVAMTAPTGSACTIDIHKQTIGDSAAATAITTTGVGTTILASVISIADGQTISAFENTGKFTGPANTHTVAEGDALFFEIDAIGTTTPADGIVLILHVYRVL